MSSDRLNELKQNLYAADAVYEAADLDRRAAESEYALAIAEALGLQIGSIVSAQTQSFGRNAKIVTKRYRVSRIDYKGYGKPPIAVFGVTIRKDGSDGETHEVWQEWKLETAPPLEPAASGVKAEGKQ